MRKFINRNFKFFAFGRLVSLLGSGIHNVAVPLYILRTTGSGLFMGIYAFLQLLPQIFLMPIGGVLGDNFNRKKIMVTMDFLSGITLLILALTINSGQLSLLVLFVCQIFLSSFIAVFDTSTSAMIPELVDKNDLLKANSFLGSIDSFAYIAGPAVGAVIFGVAGIKVVFLIDGISFILSALTEVFIKYKPHKESFQKISVKSFKSDIAQGFSFLKKSKGMKYLITFAAIANFFGIAALSVFLPYIFVEGIGFSDNRFGILQASIMAGVLLGNVLLSVASHKIGKRMVVIYGLAAEAIIFTVMGVFFYPYIVDFFGGASRILFVILIIFLTGFGISNAFLRTSIQTNMQIMIPNELRARVMATYAFSMQIVAPLGVFVAGAMLEFFEYYNLFMFSAIMIVVATVIFIKKAPAESFDPGLNLKKESVN